MQHRIDVIEEKLDDVRTVRLPAIGEQLAEIRAEIRQLRGRASWWGGLTGAVISGMLLLAVQALAHLP